MVVAETGVVSPVVMADALGDDLVMEDSDQFSLVQALRSGDPDLRDAAVSALQGSTITNGLAAQRLISLLQISDPDLQKAAASALEGTTITDPLAAQTLAMVRGRL
jgi:HEAT repeat protein